MCVLLFAGLINFVFFFQIITFDQFRRHENIFKLKLSLGSHIERIFATGTDWAGVCVLLRFDFGHSIYGYVVPSFRNFIAYFGSN